jgi:hypothetical protein
MLTAELFLPTVSGDGGTYATLAKMKSLARSGAAHPLVRATAAALVRDASADGVLHAKLIRSFLDDHILFLRDLSTAEALYHPVDLLREIQQKGMAQCDCEDVAMLAAALGMSIGLRARFTVLAFRPGGPFQHVYCDLSDGAGRVWIDDDITRPSQMFESVFPTRTYRTEV